MPDSGPNSHDHSRRRDELYDAYLFIRDTHAASFIGVVPATEAVSRR